MGRKAEVSLYRLFNVEGTHSNGGRPSRLTRDVSIRQTLGDRSRMTGKPEVMPSILRIGPQPCDRGPQSLRTCPGEARR